MLGVQVIDSKMGARKVDEKRNPSPPLLLFGISLLPPQSHPFSSSLTDFGGVVYSPRKFKGGGLEQHQPSAKDHQAEGLGPE